MDLPLKLLFGFLAALPVLALSCGDSRPTGLPTGQGAGGSQDAGASPGLGGAGVFGAGGHDATDAGENTATGGSHAGGTTGDGGARGAGGVTAAGGATATGGAAGTGGTGGTGPCSGLCASSTTLTATAAAPSYDSPNLGTGASCWELVASVPLHDVGCSNFVAPRTLTVNGQSHDCAGGAIIPLPAPVSGGYCIQVGPGEQSFAVFFVF